MKFFVAFAAFVAVAVATPIRPVAVGPAMVDHPLAVGPAWVEYPVDIGPAFVEDHPDVGAVATPVDVSPVVIGELNPGQPMPLVQIIVNVNQAGLAPVEEVVGPKPDPVIIVDEADNTPVVEPVNVVDVFPVIDVSPVQVVDMSPVVDIDPVSVVDITPGVAPEPVHVVDSVADAVIVNKPGLAPEPVHVINH